MDELKDVCLTWAKQAHVSDGELAARLTELVAELMTVDERGRMPDKPAVGLLCKGMWWPGQIMRWRVMDLATHEVLVEREDKSGSHNVAEFLALMDALKLIDVHEEYGTPTIWSPSFVAVRWMRHGVFNTSKDCPRWVPEAVARFLTSSYRRDLVSWWNEEAWGRTPANYQERDYLQRWNVR